MISGVNGTGEVNGWFAVTNVAANHFDLLGSAFINAYVAGGTAVRNDLVVLKANYVDVDDPVGIGAGVPNNSPYAIECDNPGLLPLNAGVTLTVRGMFATNLVNSTWLPVSGGSNRTATAPINYFFNSIGIWTNSTLFYKVQARLP